MRISDWSSDVCSSDLHADIAGKCGMSAAEIAAVKEGAGDGLSAFDLQLINAADELLRDKFISAMTWKKLAERYTTLQLMEVVGLVGCRSEEHTSELQSLMRISYAVFCLKKTTHFEYMQ